MFKVEKETFQNMLETYNRTDKSFEEDVSILGKWVRTQTHLPEVMDDDKIRNFLLLNKCSIERAKQKIDNYYTLRTLLPEFYCNPKSAEFRRAMEIGYWISLPKLTKDMCRVHIIATKNSELMNQLEPCPYLSQAIQFQEVRLKEDRLFADILVVDMGGTTWGYLLKVTPPLMAKFYALCEKVYSSRIRNILIINRFPAVQYLLSLLKPVLKPKIFDRIRVCEDASLLFEVFPKEMIPRDYGGEEKSLEEISVMMRKKFDEYQARFDQLENMKVDEGLRPEKLKNDEVLGFYGNFKKLDVD